MSFDLQSPVAVAANTLDLRAAEFGIAIQGNVQEAKSSRFRLKARSGGCKGAFHDTTRSGRTIATRVRSEPCCELAGQLQNGELGGA